jgi:hypothetical protein
VQRSACLADWMITVSITDDNEEEQLRLGLGQVLWYRHRLQRIGYPKVIAVLVPGRLPQRGGSGAVHVSGLGQSISGTGAEV